MLSLPSAEADGNEMQKGFLLMERIDRKHSASYEEKLIILYTFALLRLIWCFQILHGLRSQGAIRHGSERRNGLKSTGLR